MFDKRTQFYTKVCPIVKWNDAFLRGAKAPAGEPFSLPGAAVFARFPAMRLLVSCIPFDGGKSGLSVYAREVVRALHAQGHELTLVLEPDVEASSLVGPTSHVSRPTSGDDAGVAGAWRAPRWTRRAVASMLWHLFVLPLRIRRHRKEFDGFVICAANRRACAWYPLPTTATVHDLANFHVPGKYSRSRMFYLAHVLPFFAKRAQRLVAVSGATKADMVRFWHCPADRVTVLYNGLPEQWSNGHTVTRSHGPGIGETVGPSDRQTVGPDGGSAAILYISRIEHPGKNHVRLIEAYGRLPRALAEKHPLVLAGADWKDAEAVHAAAAASPHADRIRFTGFVEDAEPLWREAGFYVFPSLFEGFGLSLAEAMARGVPCACSENGSLGEIAGDAALTFDPLDAGAIAAALEALLSEDPAARAARIERGRRRAALFSWPDHARGIAKLLEDYVADRKAVARLFRIPFAKTTEPEAAETILAMARAGRDRRAAGGRAGPPKIVVTPNVDFVVNAVRGWPFRGDETQWRILREADLAVADGMPVVLLSRLLRDPLPARVAGSNLVPDLCPRCRAEGLRFYVLGGAEEALAEALAAMERKAGFPMPIAGSDHSFVKLGEEQPEIVERINAAKPDILFVALGNPKQELWLARNAAALDVPVALGIGGSFNFVAGRVKRAPRWMQKCSLEWVHRIAQEPGRLWRRYAYGLVKFSWLSLLHLLGGYRR